jgi:prepilin-type N-terminal cleavage/methylation domain-containing protein
LTRVSPANRSTRGFTLVELLVAMVISSLLAGVIFQLLSSQSRFVEVQGARGEAQGNARAVLELISAELRAVPRGGIESARRSAVTFWVPRVWGVVCGPAAGAEVPVALPGGLGFSTAGTNSEHAKPRLALDTSDVAPPVDDVSNITAPTNDCSPSAGVEVRRFRVADAARFPPQRVVYLHDRVWYELGTTSTAPGQWIRRRSGSGSLAFQALAGPVRAAALAEPGLQFRYYSASGVPLPLVNDSLTSVQRGEVGRVDVIVRSLSRKSFSGQPQSTTDSATVFLRNRV